jgi:hypothetical protein
MSTSLRARSWGVVIAAGLILATAPVAEAAPGLGTVKHYKLPTSTDPHDVTTASDGNVWFTVQGAFDPVTSLTPGSVARVTPKGDITEFAGCDSKCGAFRHPLGRCELLPILVPGPICSNHP